MSEDDKRIGIIPAEEDQYYRKLRDDIRGVILLSLSSFPQAIVPILLEISQKCQLRFEGGFHAIPEHLEHVKAVLSSDWLPTIQRSDSVKVGILGVADVPEFQEKVKLVSDISKDSIPLDRIQYSIVDRREAVLRDIADYAKQKPQVKTTLIGRDLLDDKYQTIVENSKGKFHLGLAHLTTDFTDSPLQLARNSFELIENGGMLVAVTRKPEVITELSRLGKVVGGVCWGKDIFFGGADTACLVVQKAV